MGSYVAEAGTDVSLSGEKVKRSEEKEIKVGSEGEQGLKTPPMPVPQDGKNPNELPSVRSGDGQKVDENQDPLKDWGYKQGEPDYVQKCNGNPDSQIYENGDGDLPSFSIKRLRRLPLRVTSDQQPRGEPTGIAVDRNRPEEQRQTLPDPSAVGAAHSRGCSIGVPEQVQSSFDSSRSKDELEGTSERPVNVLEERANEVGSSGVQNGEIEGRKTELENGKLAIEEPEFRNPDSGGAPGPDQSVGRVNDELPSEREEQAGNSLGQEISEENENAFVASEHTSNSTNALEGEGGNKLPQSHESYVSSANSEVQHTAPVLQVDDRDETSDSSSSGLGGVSDKENIKVESPALVVEDPNRDDNGKVREDGDLVSSAASTKPAELPSPGIVQILPPVMGSRFGSPGETTDEETDSPRSSEGFSYPDSDAMTLPYSEQIMYPSRFSCAQSSNGPSLLQYSGSMSLRSDSSTTSNRSFAFPILAPPEWNSSPARMAKAQPRRKNRFDGCCFFRLSRSRYKY